MNTTSTVLGIAVKVLVALLVIVKGLVISLLKAAVTLLKQAMIQAPKVANQVREDASKADLPEGVTNFINKAKGFTTKANEWVEAHNSPQYDGDTEIVVYMEDKKTA